MEKTSEGIRMKKNRILSLLLVMVLLMTALVPVAGFAAEDQ